MTTEEKVEKTVTLSTKQFKSLMDRLENLEAGKTYKKPQRVKDHVGYIRLYEGKPVIGYGNADEVYNKNNNKWELKLPLIVQGEEKPIVVDYLAFLNQNNQASVKILKQTATEIVESVGTAPKHDQATDKLTGDEIEMTVTRVEYEIEIEITAGELAGTKLTVPATALNS